MANQIKILLEVLSMMVVVGRPVVIVKGERRREGHFWFVVPFIVVVVEPH
jgi:hypothetical protein